ncbi:MAG TPA: ABC transporter substrate-binding protein, partial [bacterium]|nr:ABC transporter substrate-binding protein [bacterium]
RQLLVRAGVGASAGLALGGLGGEMRPADAYLTRAGKKILVVGAAQEVPNLDPSLHYDWSTRMLQQSTYDALLKYVGDPAQITPWLATGYEASPDAKTWTFHLDRRARFHNGDPVDSAAVKFSYTRTIELKQGPAWTLQGVLEPADIEMPNPSTLVFHLKKPFAPFAAIVPWWYIMNPREVRAHEQGNDYGQAWLREHDVGSGPFRIASWQPNTAYELEAVPDYWKGWPSQGHLDGFIHQVMREPSTQKLAIQRGDIDVTTNIVPEDLDLLAHAPGTYVTENRGITTFGVKMNNQRGPTANKALRKAIAYAFNYKDLINIYKGHAILENSPVPIGMRGHVDLPPYHQDLERARGFLREAGVSVPVRLTYVYVDGFTEEKEIGLALKASLDPVGINVELIGRAWPTMVGMGTKPETMPDMMAVFVTPLYNDPDAVVSQYTPTAWGQYYGVNFYKHEEVTSLVERARSIADWSTRVTLYDRIQRVLWEDSPEVFGMQYMRRWAFRSVVKGFQFCPLRQTNEIDMYSVYIQG